MTTSVSTTDPAAMAEAVTAAPAPNDNAPNARRDSAGSLVLSKGRMSSGMVLLLRLDLGGPTIPPINFCRLRAALYSLAPGVGCCWTNRIGYANAELLRDPYKRAVFQNLKPACGRIV